VICSPAKFDSFTASGDSFSSLDFAAKATGAVKQAGHKPLEPDRHLGEATAELIDHPVDHAAADHGLADSRLRRPVRSMRQQVKDRHRQIMVRVDQPGRRRDDAMPIGVGIVSEGDLIAILEPHKPGHRVRARAIHADLAVVVEGHEREGRIDLWVDYGVPWACR
jgi:hypothetical protein